MAHTVTLPHRTSGWASPARAVALALLLGTALGACESKPQQTQEAALPEAAFARTIFPSYNPQFPPPAGTKDTFALSQDYPTTFDANEAKPWKKFKLQQDYKGYMNAVLRYCLEGNTDVDFVVQKNPVRRWYHAPWLHYGTNGREYIHGLTRERPVPPKEMHPQQTNTLENWAVGFYNAPGGYTIGKVWESDSIPVLDQATFPEGTVSFKLLFTAGGPDQVPFLEGTKEWTANIYPCALAQGNTCGQQRRNATVRLLQIDIAVKDQDAGPTGWAFGTFVYDAAQPGSTVWDRMVPVGLMWGDDETVTAELNTEGAFVNPQLKQTVLNTALIKPAGVNFGKRAYMTHQGLGGRLNGPVDNPISSCISCHSKAAITEKGKAAPMANFTLTRETFDTASFRKYFASISPGTGPLTMDGVTYTKLDYSLQLSAGIRNFRQSQIDQRNKTIRAKAMEQLLAAAKDTDVRGGATPEKSTGTRKARTSRTLQVDTIPALPEVTREGLVPAH
jgi:hypothetical protein